MHISRSTGLRVLGFGFGGFRGFRAGFKGLSGFLSFRVLGLRVVSRVWSFGSSGFWGSGFWSSGFGF